MIATGPVGATGATTYGHLTRRAGQRLGRAHLRASEAHTAEEAAVRDTAAMGDLLAALTHLGRTLQAPTSGTSRPDVAGVRPSREARILNALEPLAAPRDWAAPRPTDDVGHHLDKAAFLIRSAADLWLTHHSPEGHDRSPDSSRMRHPSTLGAAIREWHVLVVLAVEVAEHLAGIQGNGSAVWDSLRTAAAMRAPLAQLDRSPLSITVARPSLRAGIPDIAELGMRVARLRHLAWSQAARGSTPAAVPTTLAGIARDVARAASKCHEALARRETEAPGRVRHLEAARRAGNHATAWDTVASLLAPLRSPHPTAHPIQIERLDIQRLLQRVTQAVDVETHPETAWALDMILDVFTGIAEDSMRALQAANDRGELYVAGHGLATEALARRPDLLHARLNDQVVPVPSLTMRRVVAAYRQAARGRAQISGEPDASPPAA